MKKFTKEQGITLIALIITIIVMLILVAVTINVALNGGLFTRAKEATYKTEIQQIQEQILLKKAEQMADNEINGTTGYNITLDNLDISTELKNKYANKLLISRDGTLHYNADNCTDEEKTIFASFGITSETVSSVEYEFDVRALYGDNFEGPEVAKIIIDNGTASYYIEYAEASFAGNYFSGTYTYTTQTENSKTGTILFTETYDFSKEETEEIPEEDQDNMDFVIYEIKENGQTINNVIVIEGMVGTTNGTAGLSVPDSNLIGTYTNENDDSVSISLSQDQTTGIFSVPGATSMEYVLYLIEDRDILIVLNEGIFEIERGEEVITITYRDEEYTKTNS